ncbi:hypothetical protein BJX76DRAFT_167570 [Aspergillus varians]
MSHKETASTNPSGSTGTGTGSSTGESSVASRIDSNDFYRIGGPGQLPEWPVETRIPIIREDSLASAAIEIAMGHLKSLNIDFEKVCFMSRYTRGTTATETDTTLLIYALFDRNRDQLISLLDTLIQILSELGHIGRVEIIDPRAGKGIKTFTVVLSWQQREEWEATLGYIVGILGRINVDWRQIMPANRGYWAEISVPTVVIKTANTVHQCRHFYHHYPEVGQLRSELSEKGLQLEILGSDGLWGLFGDLQATSLNEQVRASLDWPFSPLLHRMGISVGREFQKTSLTSSTIGGYLKIRREGEERLVGLGCYHGFRLNEDGISDPDLDSTGAKDLCWPCQSPSPGDVEIFREPLWDTANTPVPESLPSVVRMIRQSEREESVRKMQEIDTFNPYIGNVIAVSGWRNRELGRGMKAPFVFVDWACVSISRQHCPHPLNLIDDMRARLRRLCPEGAEHWRAKGATVDKLASFPDHEINIFKLGRTTGPTIGVLGPLVHAAFRIKGLPDGLHHRGFVVSTRPFSNSFCEPGDSGAWCLNADGELVGQLVGGDMQDGSGIMIPFAVILDDIEMKLGLPAGSITLP